MPKEKTVPLPGMEREAIKEIERLAEEYVEFRDARMAALKVEVESKKKLIDAMHKHKQTSYNFETDDQEQFTVELKSTEEKLKVKRNKEDDDEDEGEG